MITPKDLQTTSTITQHYDSLDGIYRSIWGDHLHHGLWITGNETVNEAVLQLIKLMVQKLNIQSGHHLCDIGCGYGATAEFLANKYNTFVTGITLSETQFLYAKAHHQKNSNPQYFLDDWLNNTLQASTFDAAYSIESSEHMPDKQKFCNECYRILRPGGKLAIFAWLSKENPKNWEIQYLLEPICREGHLPSMGTIEEYRNLLLQAGFSDIGYEDLTQNVKNTWNICLFRSVMAFFKDSDFRTYMFSKESTEREFWKTVLRIKLAYDLGSMKYGIFTATKTS